jgi:hypothetical protein
MTRTRLVQAYYALTPVFAVVDLAFGLSIRAAGITDTAWRLAYYVFVLGCWLLMRRRPAWTPAIGIAESSVNLFLLILGILGPIFALPAAVAEGADVYLPFGMTTLANLILSGTVIILSFHRHQADLANLAGPASRR